MSMAQQFNPSVTVRASAKVNLYLAVGRVRPDGFHPLATVYQAISLHDDVTATQAPAWSVVTRTPEAGVDLVGLDGPGNIALRAGERLISHHGLDVAAALDIHKSIPVAAGLAGGSADAAATLVALDRLWDLQTSDDDLLAMAAELGSDVPFALLGGTALGTGRGEQVEPIEDPHTRWWVVVPSAVGLSTPEVYRTYDRVAPEAREEVEVPQHFVHALASEDPADLAGAMHNDLEAATLDLRPDLGPVLARGEAVGALRGMVSGSGPTCVFLCADRHSADAVRKDFVTAGHEGTRTALGPVGGVHLVDSA